MFNTDFLKQLTILYVEDDELAREQLNKTLQRLFKKVILAKNGEDGLAQYKLQSETFDLILSDINMPKLNGIDMLKEIRKTDLEIPFIFITARSEIEYLIEAINLNVSHYALKPVHTTDIIKTIEKVCYKKYIENRLEQSEHELQNYTDAINNIAIIFKMDKDGNFLYVNELFLKISQFQEEEILSLNLNHILHPDIPKKYIDEAWKNVKEGKMWKGNTKFLDKFKNLFYLNHSVFALENTQNEEYITIGFLTTQENIEKREFHKKVMLNIQERNKKIFDSQKQIHEKDYQLNQLKSYTQELELKLIEEKKKNKQQRLQVQFFEDKLTQITKEKDNLFNTFNDKYENLLLDNNKTKNEKDLLLKKYTHLEEHSSGLAKELSKTYEDLDKRNLELFNLKDLLKFRESQLKFIDPKLLNK